MKKGFTLVELVIALTLLTALFSGLFYSFGQGLRTWGKVVQQAERRQIESIVAERICRDIRLGMILSGSTSAEIFLKVGSETFSYRLIENKIRRKTGVSSVYFTSDGEIKKLEFSYPAPKLVRVEIGDSNFLAAGRN